MFHHNTPSSHNKSGSVSQFVSGKSRNLQILLRYFSRRVTSAFKAGTAGCGGWVPSGLCGCCSGHSGLSGYFHTFFVLYLND